MSRYGANRPTKVIATAILSPEQVAIILQSEKGDDKTEGNTGNEGDDVKGTEEEVLAIDAKDKSQPIFQSKVQAKLIAQLNKLPHLVNSYNLLQEMELEQKKEGNEPSKELLGAIKCQYRNLKEVLGGNPDGIIKEGRLLNGQSYIYNQTQFLQDETVDGKTPTPKVGQKAEDGIFASSTMA